jgi:hypothetical protein
MLAGVLNKLQAVLVQTSTTTFEAFNMSKKGLQCRRPNIMSTTLELSNTSVGYHNRDCNVIPLSGG